MREIALLNNQSLPEQLFKKYSDKSQLYFFGLGFILSLFILASIFFPEIYFYITSLKTGAIYTYVNGWDEETYLSFQGAIGVRNVPGYYSLYLISSLQDLGISGSIQNLLFDLVLIPLTVLFTTLSLNHIIKNRYQSFFYSIITLFSSVLFNYCNPLIESLYGDRHLSTVISGWETYPSFIRSPNPLFSYFILSLSVYISFRTKRRWVLVLPFALLYYFVFQPYLYCLSVIFLAYFFKNRINMASVLFFNILAFLIISTFAYLAYTNLLSVNSSRGLNNLIGTQHMQVGRQIYFPIYTLFSILLFMIAIPLGLFKKRYNPQIFISLILCTFFISNIQLITRLAIEVKNFQDYGNSLLMGMIIIVFLEAIKNNPTGRLGMNSSQAGTLIVLILISICSLYLLWTPRMQLNLEQNMTKVTQNQLVMIKKSPLTSLVLDRDLAAKISYSQAKMPALLTSYTMNYPFVFQQCSCFYKLASMAQKHLQSRNIANLALDVTLQNMRDNPFPGKDKDYCVDICPSLKQGIAFTVYE